MTKTMKKTIRIVAAISVIVFVLVNQNVHARREDVRAGLTVAVDVLYDDIRRYQDATEDDRPLIRQEIQSHLQGTVVPLLQSWEEAWNYQLEEPYESMPTVLCDRLRRTTDADRRGIISTMYYIRRILINTSLGTPPFDPFAAFREPDASLVSAVETLSLCGYDIFQ